ncbi:MAG: hypothetical protein HGA44_18110 [Cellulomonadaceae bacterium]|nr:hypothetical protein [Cellulomonadaceae bacterium]
MSFLLHPPGDQPARVYWVRRLVVAAALLLTVALVVGLAIAVRSLLGGGQADADVPPDTAAGAATTATTPPAEQTEVTDQTGPVACTPTDLTLTLTSDARTYPAGTSPVLTVAMTNSGTATCTVDAGEAAREILITSGPDRIWSSLDCPAEPAERLLLLEPGARDEVAVTWPRIRSESGCTAGLPEPRAGTYTVTVTVLGVSGTAVVFDLG